MNVYLLLFTLNFYISQELILWDIAVIEKLWWLDDDDDGHNGYVEMVW